MKKPAVSLVYGTDRAANISQALNLIKKDLAPFKKVKSVLLKPNFTSAFNPAANTNAAAVAAVLEFLNDFDPSFSRKRFFLAETSGEAYQRGESMEKVYSRFGFDSLFRKYGNLEIWDPEKAKKFLKVKIKTIKGTTEIRIPQRFLDFDYRISLAVPKTHDTVGVTLGIKNYLMGIIKQEDKGKMHGLVGIEPQLKGNLSKLLNRLVGQAVRFFPWQLLAFFQRYGPGALKDKAFGFDPDRFVRSVVCLHQNLVMLGEKFLPDLNVIDGASGMDRDGPVYGRARRLGVAIASTDPVAADAVATRMMGFKPEKIAYLRVLAKMGKGTLFPKVIGGKEISLLAKKFTPHYHYPYQQKAESLLQVN